MGRERQQTPADLTEQELATLDALLAEPEPGEQGATEEDEANVVEPPGPPPESVSTVGDAERRRFVRAVLVALDAPLGCIDERHLTVGGSESFEELIEAREAALYASLADRAGTA